MVVLEADDEGHVVMIHDLDGAVALGLEIRSHMIYSAVPIVGTKTQNLKLYFLSSGDELSEYKLNLSIKTSI